MANSNRNTSDSVHDVIYPSTSTEIFLNEEVTLIFQYFIFTVMCPAIDLFGVGSNIINIICFVKQGFKDPINISLLCLGVSDLGCVMTLIWLNICFTPAFMTSYVPFDSTEFQYLTAGVPHTVFTRLTGCITAFITLERCVCITLPLKVKNIMTPYRVSVITIIIIIILVASAAPEYVVNKLGLKYFPHRNTTLIGLVFTEHRDTVARVSYIINNVIIPCSSFVVVIVCTGTLVLKLHQNTEWRLRTSVMTDTDGSSKRNQRISKIVVTISILFISCFIPVSIIFLVTSLEPEFFIGGKYGNLFAVLGGFGVILESINSSVNIFIYYYMSKNYRNEFHQLLCLD